MKYLTRASKRARNEEQGLAIASVAILGAFLVMVTVVVMLRSMTEQGLTRDDRLFEQSLHTAEASIDFALAEFVSDPAFNTTHTKAAVDTKDEVIAAAIDIYNGSGISAPVQSQALHETGEGVSIAVKPLDAAVLYGVGFSPSVEAYLAGTGKARVVVSELGPPFWSPQQAILVGGPLRLEANLDNRDVEMFGDGGWVHANGDIQFKDGKSVDNIHGCLTASGEPDTVTKDNGDPRYEADHQKVEGPYTNDVDNPPSEGISDCWDNLGAIEHVPVPVVDPLNIHYLAQYELCPKGMFWGPNGATSPFYSGQMTSIPGQPCTGDEITELTPGVPVHDNWVLGIKNVKAFGKSGVENWNKRAEFGIDAEDGVFFSWGRNIKMQKLKHWGDRHWTIIASHREGRLKALPNTPVFNDLTCLGEDDLQVWNPKDSKWENYNKDMYGDIELQIENDDLFPHPEGKGYTIVTAGDVDIKIKGKKDLPDPGELYGIVMVHEQFKIESADAIEKGAIYGSIVGEDACDTKDSLINNKISEFKKGDIVFNADFQSTDFVVDRSANGEYRLLNQSEM